jgi:hypothetical protein
MIGIERSCSTESTCGPFLARTRPFCAGLLLVLKERPYKNPYTGVRCLNVGCCRMGRCAMLSDMAIESLVCARSL